MTPGKSSRKEDISRVEFPVISRRPCSSFSPTYPFILAARGHPRPTTRSRSGVGSRSVSGSLRRAAALLFDELPRIYGSIRVKQSIALCEYPVRDSRETTSDTAQGVGCPPQSVSAAHKFRHPLLVSPTVLSVSPYVLFRCWLECFMLRFEGLRGPV